MAELRVLGSSSEGNCYIIDCGYEQLIVELGVHFDDVLRELDFDISKVSGCLVTHKHKDHSEYINKALSFNLSVYSCESVAMEHEGVKVAKTGVSTRIGGFSVQPIEVEHSVPCYSFIIRHREFGKILFITDCRTFTYKFKNVNHILCECNWDDAVVLENAFENDKVRSMHENHLELMQTDGIVKHNFCECTQNVVLLHMSSRNIRKKKACDMIKTNLGFDNVFIAEKGLKLELNKDDF
jgi:ribonuclease BN (tRNA processing enzyme)